MPEPVDPAGDYLVMRGTVVKAALTVYDPSRDTSDGDPYGGPSTPIRGSKGSPQLRTEGVGDGSVVVTTVTWTITAATADDVLPQPPQRSRIVASGKTWVITTVGVSPTNGRLFVCDCVLA